MLRTWIWVIPLLLMVISTIGCRPGVVSAPSGVQRPYTYQPPVRQPPVTIQPPAVVQNPWKPSKPARDWRHIVIHHTASSKDSVESIHEAHLKRGWEGVGYHFVIGNGSGMKDGEIEATFRWKTQMHGAHAGNDEYNQHGIGICLVGNFEDANPSASQLASVKRLVGILKSEYSIKSEKVIGHKDVKATACPGKKFPMTEVSLTEVMPFFVQTPQPVVSQLARSDWRPTR